MTGSFVVMRCSQREGGSHLDVQQKTGDGCHYWKEGACHHVGMNNVYRVPCYDGERHADNVPLERVIVDYRATKSGDRFLKTNDTLHEAASDSG